MPVTLRVSSYQSQVMGADAARVFNQGGTIGRAMDNDWVLPDQDRFVSGLHAVISVENGGYVLTDHSTNGTILNGAELPRGARVALNDGDRLTIGNYDISVSVAPARDAAPAPSANRGVASGAYPFDAGQAGPLPGAASSVDPLDFFGDAPQRRSAPPAAESDHAPPGSDFFAPPDVRPEARPTPPHSNPHANPHSSPPSPAAPPPHSAPVIPENWDETGFSMPAEPAAPSPPYDESSPPYDPDALFAPDPPDAASDPGESDPFFGADAAQQAGAAQGAKPAAGGSPPPGGASADLSGTRPGIAPGAAVGTPSSAVPGTAPGTPPGATFHGGGPAAAASPPRQHGPGTGSGGHGPGADGVAALLRSAGVDPADVDAATMASLGEVLHVAVEGLMDVLRARAAIKNQFRVPMTTLKPVENNPLKFSADANDALFNLLARRNRSYKAPVDAFREAFDDMRAHQIAMMAGMRAAFAALLRRFDPDVLQESFDRGMKRGALLEVMNKTKYWDLYREMFDELGDDDATFRRLFGDEFAQAYEEQMQRLTMLKKRQ